MPVTKASQNNALPENWSRLVITSVTPRVDNGRWPVARTRGEMADIMAGIIIDGHEKVAAEVVYRHNDGEEQVLRMKLRYNDEYVASFPVAELGCYFYYVRAWHDHFATWLDQFQRRVKGGADDQELRSELLDGASILRRAAEYAGDGATRLHEVIQGFEQGNIQVALDPTTLHLAQTYDPRIGAIRSDEVTIRVDPEWARYSAWYEFFPRSAATERGKHGTLDDAADRLPRIKELGFDVVYLPPVHPIGKTFRKGKDNAPTAEPDDPGSPWAIGGDLGDGTLGGHKSVHPELGGIEAFDRFVHRATELDIRVAIDIAFQTSPDHPYVKEHPEWFKHRPDGTIRYAENPPKKYQDVYPFDFECADWPALWQELKSIFDFWIGHGIRIFRVDNPHTKPFAFWEWCLGELRKEHQDLVFLAEAFTRPKTMYTLAKLGFNQSYTYFTWRNSKQELIEYGTELFQTEVADFYRPNFWPNTPDILTEYLVHGGRPAHVIRYVLAATMSSAYGIYGPPYEHLANIQHPEREEYANNEKYEIRTWNWHDPNSLQPLMKRVNRIRRDNRALQFMRNIRFLKTDNPNLLAYSKEAEDNLIVCVVNLDPYHKQSGWIELPLDELKIPADTSYQVQDLLGGEWYFWNGRQNYVELNPHVLPAHILKIHRQVRTERDFPYYA